MAEDETQVVPVKTSKKTERTVPPAPLPRLSFEEFVLQARLTPVRAEGLQVHLRATEGVAPRPLVEWQAALNHYQAQA